MPLISLLGTYSDSNVDLEKVNVSLEEFIDLQKTALKSAVKTQKIDVKSDYMDQQQLIRRSTSLVNGFYILVYENKSHNATYYEKLQATTLENLQISLPFDNSHRFEIIAQPRSDILVLYKVVDRRSIDQEDKNNSLKYRIQIEYNYALEFKYTEQELERILREKSRLEMRKDGNNNDLGIIVRDCKLDDGFAFLYENTSTNVRYRETLNFLSMNNVRLEIPKLNAVTSIQINLDPKQKMVIFLKRETPYNGFSYKSSSTYTYQIV